MGKCIIIFLNATMIVIHDRTRLCIANGTDTFFCAGTLYIASTLPLPIFHTFCTLSEAILCIMRALSAHSRVRRSLLGLSARCSLPRRCQTKMSAAHTSSTSRSETATLLYMQGHSYCGPMMQDCRDRKLNNSDTIKSSAWASFCQRIIAL